MTEHALSRRPLYVIGGVGLAVALIWSQIMAQVHRVSPPLAVGAALADLVLFVPLLWYGFVVRRGLASPRTTFAVAALGLASVRWLTPEPSVLLTAALFALEGTIVASVAIAVARVFRRFSEPEERRRALLDAILPARVAAILRTEHEVLGWAIGRAQEAPARVPWANLDLWRSQIVALSILVILEAAVVHLLLMDVWPVGIWVITSVELYALVFLIGDARALAGTGVDVDGETLRVRFGFRWRLEVPVRWIASIDPAPPAASWDLKMALQDEPNVVVTFDRAVAARGAYGFVRNVRRLGLRVDTPERLRTTG